MAPRERELGRRRVARDAVDVGDDRDVVAIMVAAQRIDQQVRPERRPADADVQSLAAAALAVDAVQLAAREHGGHVALWRGQRRVQDGRARALLRAQALDVPPARPQIHRNKICGGIHCIGSRGRGMSDSVRGGQGVVGRREGRGEGDCGEGRVVACAPGDHDGRDQAAAPHVAPRFDEIEIVG